MHDSKIDRTTTGKGRVSEMTLDSIQQFVLKNGVSIRTRYHIPTLREVLLACQGKVLINLDKADRYFDLVVPLLEETGTTRQIIMKGRKPAHEVDSLYGQYLDELIYMPIVGMDKEEDIEVLKGHIPANRCAYELTFKAEPTYMLQANDLLKGKSRIWVNCLWDTLCGGHEDDQAILNPDEHYGYLIHTLGTSIIQTDRPEFLIDYLKKHNLR
jgi:glycerophosphoryl diester phosphodiesterase